jgi:hypothetical protein
MVIFFIIFFLDIYEVRKIREENSDEIDKEEKKGNSNTILKKDNNKQNDNGFGVCCP